MSTHNIGFYEDLTKIIFELSSNIIKYSPYFFSSFFVQISRSVNAAERPPFEERAVHVFSILLFN